MDRLNDTSRWVIVRGVPIFSPHTRYNREGEALYTIGMAELQQIADECNRLESEVGVPVKVSVGHTMQVPETQQAPVVGYARHLRVGTFGPKKLPALIADFYYARDEWERAKKYPFRSAEFYPSSKQISGVALLDRDPELDLGALIFERGLEAITDGRSQKIYFYSRSWGDDMFNDVTHYEGKEIQGDAGAGSGENIPEKPGMGLELDPEFEKHAHAYHAKHLPMLQHMHAHYSSTHATEHAAQHQAGAGAPGLAAVSGTNTAMPAPVGHPGAQQPMPHPGGEGEHNKLPPHESVQHQRATTQADAETTRMQTVQHDIRLAQYERQNAEMLTLNKQMTERIAALEKTNRLAVYERDLTALLGQGYQFDLATEMADVGDLSAEQFAKHCDRIKKNYQRGPVGTPMLKPYSGPVESPQAAKKGEIPEIYEGRAEDFENETFDEIMKHVRSHPSTSYEQAQEEVLAKRRKTG